MALSNVTTTFNLSDYIGGNFDPRRTKVYLTTNAEKNLITDKSTGEVRLGGGTVTLAADGSVSATHWAPGPDANPASWQTTYHIDFVDTGTKKRQTTSIGPFTVTTSGLLSALIEEQAVPAEYLTTVTQQLDVYTETAAASATSAAASASAALQSAQDAKQIDGVGTVSSLAPGATPTASITGENPSRVINLGIPAGVADDASMTAVADNPASAFRASLSASYASKSTQTTVETGRLSDVTLAGRFADKGANNAFTGTGNNFTSGYLGVGSTPTNRNPVGVNTSITASGSATPGTSDMVTVGVSAGVKGDFTGITGSNSGHAWAFNLFGYTGWGSGDANGLTNLYGVLGEMSVRSPSGVTIGNVVGMMAEAAFFGAPSGATVTSMQSMRVGSPKRKDGATAGTAQTAYGLFVETVTNANVGSTNSFSLFVEGGISRFKGRVDISDTVANCGTGDVNIYAGQTDADGSRLTLQRGASGGHVIARIPTTGGIFGVFDGTATQFSIERTGIPRWNQATNEQTTVGAAGAASALPAAPTRYLKVKDSAGTVLVIPAYAAT